MGAEDTQALCLLLYEGGTVVYQPSAFVYHYHHRDYDSLQRVFTGYGRGLTAFYTSVLMRHPLALTHLLGLSGRALRDLFSSGGSRKDRLEDDFPRELIRANLRGMLEGPLFYLRARRCRFRADTRLTAKSCSSSAARRATGIPTPPSARPIAER